KQASESTTTGSLGSFASVVGLKSSIQQTAPMRLVSGGSERGGSSRRRPAFDRSLSHYLPATIHHPEEPNRDAVLGRQPVVDQPDACEAHDVVSGPAALTGRDIPHRDDDVPGLQVIQRAAHLGGVRYPWTALDPVADRDGVIAGIVRVDVGRAVAR